ncbi:MAG: hypothetical protein GXO78_05335 [Calditrichaeota bacterium]|nr:hypothetical protein [Calditrichota bacterium]
MKYSDLIIRKIQEAKQKQITIKQKDKFSVLQHQEDDLLFQVKFKDIDKYGIVVDYISIQKLSPILDVDEINRRLEQQADAIQKRITYLLEDFKLIEIDRMSKRAQLRSYPPYKKENSKYFYEIVLDEGVKIHFQRYQYSMDEKRYEKITSQLTLEIFARLIDDLVEIIQ